MFLMVVQVCILLNFNATNLSTMSTGGSTYVTFIGCTALTTLNIGSNVTKIPEYAFYGCSSLLNIYSKAVAPPTALTDNTFFPGANVNVCTLHVPAGSGYFYSNANVWKLFFNIVEDDSTPTYTITGQVTLNSNPLSGVTMAYTGGSTVTNSSGQYTITVNEGATVTITPSLSGYTFTPPSITCSNVSGNLTNQNFTAQIPFVPVTSINGIPTTATATLPLTLTGTVVPSNATNQTITWSVLNAGTTGATLTGTTLNTTNPGTVIVEAKVVNGASPTQNYTQQCAIEVFKATLGGTVSITGNTVFGQTLTAVTTGLSSTPVVALGSFSYQWKRNGNSISGATNSTYSLVQDDIGKTITVTVSAANCTGEVTSASSATVQKATQTAPTAAPTKLSSTSTSITLNTVTGCEYNINGGAYQTSPTFGGLNSGTSYTFTQRKVETPTLLPSPASPSASFTTEEGTPPVLGGTVTFTGSAVFGETLTANTSGLYCTPSGPLGTLVYQWKRNGTINTGTNSATHTLVADDIGCTISVTVTSVNCTGSVTSTSSATVTKATQTAPAAPTMESNSPTSITLKTVAGCEYNINGGEYQASPEFNGLTPSNSYTFTQRKAETVTHFASPLSPVANFSTAPPEFVPVTYIVEIPSTATAGIPLSLTGKVIPNNATHQIIKWSILNAGSTGANIIGSTFIASSEGTAIVLATITNGTAIGTDYTQECTISVNTTFVPVTNIINVPTNATATVPLTLTGTVIPSNATKQAIVWIVSNAGTTGATLSDNILNTVTAGVVGITAVIVDGKAIGEDYIQTFTIDVNPLNINEPHQNLHNLTLYPNPTTGQLRITNYELRIESVEIYDAYGRKVLEDYNSYDLTVLRSYDLTVFPAGVYFVRIQTDAGEVVKKVVKE